MVAFVDRLSPALRGLLRNKRYSALAIGSLAIAIALNTTMYSVTDAIVFPHVQMRQPENLYRLAFFGDYQQRVPLEVKAEAVRRLTFVEDVALKAPNFGGDNIVERGSLMQTARVLNVSSNYFKLLGSTPLAGRLLSPGDENAGTQPVVVSEKFWKQVFAERTKFDTASFTLDGVPRIVVGLLAYESDFPGENTDVWQLPTGGDVGRWPHRLLVFNVVRLREGVAIAAVTAELEAVAAHLSAMALQGPKEARFSLVKTVGEPLRIQNFHLAIIGAVLFVLLVACFNLANLQLARGMGRTRELATRAAVGATRGDIITLLVSEAAWLAGAALILGLILTFWGMRFAASAVPPSLGEYLINPQVSWRLFAFAATSGVLALAIVGLAPAIRVSRVNVSELIKSGAGTGAMRKTQWQAGSLVVCQVGLALALMVGATILIKAAAGLYQLDINPTLERIVTARIGVRQIGEPDRRTLAEASNLVIARARAIKGVAEAATMHSVRPPHQVISIAEEGHLAREVKTGTFGYGVVSSAFIRTYGGRMLKGRDFLDSETDLSAIIDDQTARYLWPGTDPVGRQLKFGSDSRHDEGWFTVVGVVEYTNTWSGFTRANQTERLAPSLGAIYILNTADTARIGKASSFSLHVRGTEDMERLPLTIRQSLADRSAGIMVWVAQRLYSQLMLDVLRQRQDFVAAMFTSFALIALGLSALGVYAVVSHTVTRRTREIGVRVALGASERDIRQSVLHYGNVMALSGIAIGLIIAAGAVGYLENFIREDDRWDNKLFALAAVVLFSVTLLATWVPARRAMRINPVEALRHD